MASNNEPLMPESERIIEEALARLLGRPRSASQDALQAGGQAMGAAASALASNRSAGVDAAIETERINAQRQADYFARLIAREQEKRASQTDAYRKTVAANYVENPNLPESARFKPQRSQGQLDAARAMRAESQARLDRGDSYIPSPPEPAVWELPQDLLRAGGMERGLGWGSVAGTVAGAVPSSAWGKIGKGAMKFLDFIF